MSQPHQIKHYQDGTATVPYCSICGHEYPTGDCSGKFENYIKPVDKEVDKKEEQS